MDQDLPISESLPNDWTRHATRLEGTLHSIGNSTIRESVPELAGSDGFDANSLNNRVRRTSYNFPEKLLSRFTDIHEIGCGSFGIVYRAFDPIANRDVAIKVARAELRHHSVYRKNLLREIRLVSRLEHPSIATIFEAKVDSEDFYFVMKYCPGITLDAWINNPERASDWRACVQLFVQIAETIAHGHSQGVLHRDIKPLNIVVDHDRPGEPKVYVLDYGLAYGLDEAMTRTKSSMLVGTTMYLAPEQLDRKCEHPTVMAEVYALGLVLYEIVAKRSPFSNLSFGAAILAISEGRVEHLSKVCPELPAGLTEICHKCLRTMPAQRYQTVDQLIDDLKRLLRDEPVHAKPQSLIEKGKAWMSKSRRSQEFGLALIAINVLVLVWAIANFPLSWLLFSKSKIDKQLLEVLVPAVLAIIPVHSWLLWSSFTIYNQRASKRLIVAHFALTIIVATIAIATLCISGQSESLDGITFERLGALGLMLSFAEMQSLLVAVLMFSRFFKATSSRNVEEDAEAPLSILPEL